MFLMSFICPSVMLSNLSLVFRPFFLGEEKDELGPASFTAWDSFKILWNVDLDTPVAAKVLSLQNKNSCTLLYYILS